MRSQSMTAGNAKHGSSQSMTVGNAKYKGRTLHMSINEIRREYREAANPNHQVRILADLNACGQDMICEIVGHVKRPPKKPTEKHIAGLPNELLLDMHAKGLHDNAMAEIADVTPHKVAQWRWYHGLVANKAKSRNSFANFPDAAARELYSKGCSDVEIGGALKLSRGSVYRWHFEAGLKANRKKRKKSEVVTCG